MKSLLLVLGSTLLLFGCNRADLNSEKGKTSYAIGQQIGHQMKARGIEIDPSTLAASISDVLAGKDSRLSVDEMQKTMMALNQKMMAQQEKMMAEQMGNQKDAKEKGDKFLAENKKKKGVKATASGLQYEIVTKGEGPKPKASDEVKVNYRGTLVDGTEFDSSYKRGEPAKFGVGQVIPGWTEALQMMSVGSKWKLAIPAKIAYGPRSLPGIPPNSTLLFDVELLEIVKK